MNKKFINGVPQYNKPYVSDCFTNALSSYLFYVGLDPDLVLSDYLSFMYQPESGFVGVNYLLKPYPTVEFTEEQLNTSHEFAYFPTTAYYDYQQNDIKIKQNRINVFRYIEKDSERAYIRMKELLHRNTPVIAAVDLYYMRYHRAYKKDHGLHYVVITGYDEEKNCLELFDKYILASCDFCGTIPINEIMEARTSDNPQKNIIAGAYTRPILNHWVEIEVGKDFNTGQDGILAILQKSLQRMCGQEKGRECDYGLDMMDDFRRDILLKSEQDFDELNQYLFKEYYNQTFKTFARSRMRFKIFLERQEAIHNTDLLNEICMYLALSSKYWNISANLCYKLAYAKDIELIAVVEKQLGLARDAEARAVEKMFVL